MNNIEDNEELYRAWIGEKNQEKYLKGMKKGGFNIFAFLLTDLYFLTRKMFAETIIYAIIIIIMNLILNLLNVPQSGFTLAALIIKLFFGFSFYKLYKNSINRKIKKYKNKGLSYEEQLEIARKYGGDKITFAAVGVFFIELIMILGSILMISYLTVMVNGVKDTNTNSSFLRQEKNKWQVEDINISYNSHIWKLKTVEGIQALQYKNSNNILTYVGSSAIDNIEMVRTSEFKEEFENEMIKLEENGTQKIIGFTWKNINENTCLCKLDLKEYSDELNIDIQDRYYYYFLNNNVYAFLGTEIDKGLTFFEDADKIFENV